MYPILPQMCWIVWVYEILFQYILSAQLYPIEHDF